MRQRTSPGPDHYAGPRRRDGRCDDAGHGAGGRVDLKLGHHAKDGTEVIDVQGEIDMYTAPRLRPAAMSSLPVEVVVHRGAVHADGLGDLGNGVLPLAVRAGS